MDGARDASLEVVRPNGVIVTEWELVDQVLKWIADQLQTHSPVGKTGKYRRSHTLFTDGRETDPDGVIPPAEEYVFINTAPYARKIELGSSSQAPDGVYQVIAVMARRQFRDVAQVTFTYRTAIKGTIVTGRRGNKSTNRTPAIIVTLRK